MGRTLTGGPKGLGQVTDSAQTVGDLNWIIGLIAATGNVRQGTTAERDALEGAKLFQGLLWINTTESTVEQYDTTSGWSVLLKRRGSYTPALVGLNLGDGGSIVGKYSISAGACEFWVTVVLGTGASATGDIYLGLPLSADTTFKDVGQFLALNPNGSRVQGVVGLQNASRVWLLSTSNAFMSNSQPWPWVGGCEIRAHGTFVLP